MKKMLPGVLNMTRKEVIIMHHPGMENQVEMISTTGERRKTIIIMQGFILLKRKVMKAFMT